MQISFKVIKIPSVLIFALACTSEGYAHEKVYLLIVPIQTIMLLLFVTKQEMHVLRVATLPQIIMCIEHLPCTSSQERGLNLFQILSQEKTRNINIDYL